MITRILEVIKKIKANRYSHSKFVVLVDIEENGKRSSVIKILERKELKQIPNYDDFRKDMHDVAAKWKREGKKLEKFRVKK